VAESTRRDSAEVNPAKHDANQKKISGDRPNETSDPRFLRAHIDDVEDRPTPTFDGECPETEVPLPTCVDWMDPRATVASGSHSLEAPEFGNTSRSGAASSATVDSVLPRFDLTRLGGISRGAVPGLTMRSEQTSAKVRKKRSRWRRRKASMPADTDAPALSSAAAAALGMNTPESSAKQKPWHRLQDAANNLEIDKQRRTSTLPSSSSSSSSSSSYTPSVTPLYSTECDGGMHFGVKNVVSPKRKVQFGRKEIISVEESIHLWMTRTPNQLSFRPSSLPFRPMLKKVWDKFPWDQAELSCGTDSDEPMTRCLDNQTLRKTYFCRVDGVVYVPGRPQYHQERLPAVFDLRLFCPPQNTDPHSWSHVADNDQFHCACGYFPGNENFVFWD